MIATSYLRALLAGLLLADSAYTGSLQAREESETAIAEGFLHPPAEVRTRMFWRVFGPAWTPPEIDYQLGLLQEAGVGGVMTFFMYPVATEGAAVHNQRFLSPEFLDTFGYAARKAAAMNLRFSVAGGTGWPFGGPSVAPADAAQHLRRVALPIATSGLVTVPKMGPDEQLFALRQGQEDLTSRVDRQIGLLRPPDAQAPVFAYLTGPTRMRVKRPALGGEGLVLDHYQSPAAARYLEAVVAPMLRAAPGQIESIFCDSLEVYGANWTTDLPAEFQRRRGYPLTSVLDELFDKDSPRSPAIRFDYWRTLAELTEERFTEFTADWAHQHGVKLELEAYGTPPNPLTAAAYIDVPTGEQYEWKGFSLSRLAASGAHLTGKRIIGAEAWTWLGLPNRLGDSLSDMKLASDLHFLAGVNDLTGVDFAYSPRSVPAPGWLPYYGPVVNQHNPQWPWFRQLMDYTSRCQWLLRQGRPVAPVAVYLPVEDKFATGSVDQMTLGFDLRDHFVSGQKTDEFGLQTALHHESDLLHGLLANGLNYDGIDFFAVNRLAEVKNGHLLAGDGDYTLVILPRLIGIEAKALEKLTAFCRSGGTVIATGRLPERVYADGNGSVPTEASLALLRELFADQPEPKQSWSRTCGKGKVIFLPDEKSSLASALREFPADIHFQSPLAEIGFVHRRTPELDIYFLANTGEQRQSLQADFRTDQTAATLWNPLDGSRQAVSVGVQPDGSKGVTISLPPRGSIFVVFSKPTTNQPARESVWHSEDLAPVWHLEFTGAPAPASRVLTNLTSWTIWPEAQFYSGSATYTANFDWQHPLPKQAWLELGIVREVADVTLNGHPAGAAWIPPFEVEITDWLKPGPNTVSITVANLPLNRFLGTPDEDLTALRAAYGERFPSPQEKQIVHQQVPSGLLGPVRLRSALE